MNVREFLVMVKGVLGRCAVLGILLILVWFAASVLPGDVICGTHGRLFGLSAHECALVNYSGIGLVKMMVLILFVFPWITIQLYLKKLGRTDE